MSDVIRLEWIQAEKCLVQKLRDQYECGGSPLDTDIVAKDGKIRLQLAVLCAFNKQIRTVIDDVQNTGDVDRVVLLCPDLDLESLRLGIEFIFTGSITIKMDQIEGKQFVFTTKRWFTFYHCF